MPIYQNEDGTCTISSGGMWLPGIYENRKACWYAYRLPNEVLYRTWWDRAELVPLTEAEMSALWRQHKATPPALPDAT